MHKRNVRYLVLLVGLVFALALWHYGSKRSMDLRFFIATPAEVGEYAIKHYHALAVALCVTALETISGLLIALILGHIAAFFLVFYPRMATVLIPISVGTQVLPIITLAPLFVLAFGLGLLSKVMMVALMCFFPILVSLNMGFRQVSPNVRELLFLYNTRTWFRLLRIYWPLSLPHLFSGLRVATTMAIMGAIVTEFLGAYNGLGKNLYLAPKSSTPELMVISIALTGLLGWSLYSSVTLCERHLGKWYLRSETLNPTNKHRDT